MITWKEVYTIRVKSIIITTHYSLLRRQVHERWPAIVAWKVVSGWIIKTVDVGHFMNGGRGLSDAVAIPVNQWELPVEVAVCDVNTKCIADIV